MHHTRQRVHVRARARARARRCGYAIRLRKAGKPPASFRRSPFGRDRQMLLPRGSFRHPHPHPTPTPTPRCHRHTLAHAARGEREVEILRRKRNRALQPARKPGHLNFCLAALRLEGLIIELTKHGSSIPPPLPGPPRASRSASHTPAYYFSVRESHSILQPRTRSDDERYPSAWSFPNETFRGFRGAGRRRGVGDRIKVRIVAVEAVR